MLLLLLLLLLLLHSLQRHLHLLWVAAYRGLTLWHSLHLATDLATGLAYAPESISSTWRRFFLLQAH
jgi:hypothetical protein